MEYRRFGKSGWKVSALGYGIMRMPLLDDKIKLDRDESVKLIRGAIDRGVNYIDTAWPYHQEQSEPLVALALRDGYREKVKVATKLPSWLIEKYEDLDHFFTEQLKRLEINTIDVYLLHNINRKNWENLKSFNILSWLEDKKESGLIDLVGFSFHDDYELFQEIIDSWDGWDLCQIQYNFMGKDYQAGQRGVHYAATKGLAVVVMEPLKGGQLAYQYPQNVALVWADSKRGGGPVERALNWLWDQDEISVVLSGMNAAEQIVENCEIASKSSPSILDEEEKRLYDRVAAAYKELSPIPCIDCSNCLPCPYGVNIPRNFELYNDAVMYGSTEQCIEIYSMWFPQKEHGSQCQNCGICLPKCPQKIDIPLMLVKVEKNLGGER